MVTTDFDLDITSKAFGVEKRIWSPEQVIRYQKEKYGKIRSKDIFSYEADGERVALERRLRKQGLSLYPCLNLLPMQAQVIPRPGYVNVFWSEQVDDLLHALVRLTDPATKKPIEDKGLTGRTYIDTVINYYRNEEKYGMAIKRLKDEFSVMEISICRERESILDEGYTDEELREDY